VTSPSNVVHDVDPIVERVILRCLERDPAMSSVRPLVATARLVRATLFVWPGANFRLAPVNSAD